MLLPTFSSLLLGLAVLQDVVALPQSNPGGLLASSGTPLDHAVVKRDERRDVAQGAHARDGLTLDRSDTNKPHVEKRFLDVRPHRPALGLLLKLSTSPHYI
jgi:hypothetical protein